MILSKITKPLFFLAFLLLLGGCTANDPAYLYFQDKLGDSDLPDNAIPFSFKTTTLYSTSEFILDTFTSQTSEPTDMVIVILNADRPKEGSLVQISELSGERTGRILAQVVADQDGELKGHYLIDPIEEVLYVWLNFQGKDYNAKLSFQKTLKIGGTMHLAASMVKGEPRNINSAPTAYSGGNQLAVIGDTVILNGSGTDPEGQPLTYKWTLTDSPTDSSTVITNEYNASAELFVGATGTYTVSLAVNDGELDSEPATANIEVISIRDGLTKVLIELYSTINSLPTTSFSRANLANTMTNKLNVIMKSIEKGNYKGAVTKLKNDILSKTDGCSTDNNADKTDWIVNCDSQKILYDLLKRVETLMER